jgi:hypothetical protein
MAVVSVIFLLSVLSISDPRHYRYSRCDSPADPAPDASSMNYCIVVAGGVWIFATIFFFMPGGGKTWFK